MRQRDIEIVTFSPSLISPYEIIGFAETNGAHLVCGRASLWRSPLTQLLPPPPPPRDLASPVNGMPRGP